MNTQDPQYAMDQSWLDDYVSVESHEDCEDDAVSVDDPRSDNHTFSLNDTVLENYAPVYVSNMAQQVRPVWNYNSILYQPPVYHGPSMNDGSSLFATSPAMEYLRGSNTSMGLYPPPEEHNTSSMLPVSNSTATHALHANFPGPVQQVAPSTVVQGSVSMSDETTATSTSSVTKAKSTKMRSTCEGCRKLKVRCHPGRDGGACEKCHKKGIPCVFEARAGYGTKTKGTRVKGARAKKF